MKAYEKFRNNVSIGRRIARVGIVAGTLFAVPYICNDGCAYTGSYARAAERNESTVERNEIKAAVETQGALETLIEK